MDLTTKELAKSLGVRVELLRVWKQRGHIPSAPYEFERGRGHTGMWSDQAQAEAAYKAHGKSRKRKLIRGNW